MKQLLIYTLLSSLLFLPSFVIAELNEAIESETFKTINTFRNELYELGSPEEVYSRLKLFLSAYPVELDSGEDQDDNRADVWIDSHQDIDRAFLKHGEKSSVFFADLLTKPLSHRSKDEFNTTDYLIASEMDLKAGGRLRLPRAFSDYALDMLGVLDVKRSVSISRAILKGNSSGVHKVIALRNLIWASRETSDNTLENEAIESMKAIVSGDNWYDKDDIDFSEAFDLFVGLERYEEIPYLLNHFANEDSYEKRWPAYLAIFKLLERDSSHGLEKILENFDKLDDMPFLRADLFALLEPQAEKAEEIILEYLRKAAPTEEYEKFFAIYPLRSSFVDDTLISEDIDLSQGRLKSLFTKSPQDFKRDDERILSLMKTIRSHSDYFDPRVREGIDMLQKRISSRLANTDS